MAVTEEAPPASPKGPSLVIQIAALLGVTVAAIGMGWASGTYLIDSPAGTPAPDVAHASPEEKIDDKRIVLPLEPITTNIASPKDIWVRMELAIALDAPQPQEMVDEIHQDLLAFIRTVRLDQIETASGFLHLKADLEERAAIRSDGHVKNVFIRTLLFE
ncbi:flagellar basal body-associated FliL family protein [Mesorhizobium sp. SB112]|uniref:flagellar basal body-associated FliL family protein n=1 Tax=Mesorhizobium sp. SB112 TaxID=3151853 RepID=UPI003265EF5B